LSDKENIGVFFFASTKKKEKKMNNAKVKPITKNPIKLNKNFTQISNANHNNSKSKIIEIKKQHFTIIELLVVMAIIILLAGLIFPSINRAKKQAITTSCLNNLTQINKASSLYLSDYEYYMPCFAADTGMSNNGKTWLGFRTKSGSDVKYELKTGFISDYLKENTKVLFCPAFRKQDSDTENSVTNGTGYGYNTCIGTWIYITGSSYGSGAGLKVNQVTNPTNTVAFADAANGRSTETQLKAIAFLYPMYSVKAPFYRTVFDSLNMHGDNVHFRHNASANVIWLDGHSSQEKASRLKAHDLARRELIGNFGPEDNSLYDPWDL